MSNAVNPMATAVANKRPAEPFWRRRPGASHWYALIDRVLRLPGCLANHAEPDLLRAPMALVIIT